MVQVVIENPILNSPFVEPTRHFRFDDEGITDQIAEGRRTSIYFIPIAQPRKKGMQAVFETEWTQDRIEEKSSSTGSGLGFPRPKSGKIAIKVINHYGDEVLKAFGVPP